MSTFFAPFGRFPHTVLEHIGVENDLPVCGGEAVQQAEGLHGGGDGIGVVRQRRLPVALPEHLVGLDHLIAGHGTA
ncbi:hypothetical protein ABZX30_19235 [Streptomyces sp. NPDC004542]|uniref:hypothetical protein n=1 Tax=Streptomyces sp. NPDC004542 TaxID=3154281 RepID=UPI0033BA4C04